VRGVRLGETLGAGSRRLGWGETEEQIMPKFMDVHEGFVGATQQDLIDAHDADLAIEAGEGVHFEKAWMDPVSGKAFCLSTGPSKEAIMRVHERAGHPAHEIHELTVEV
jgi:hypothetical protein